MQARTLTYRALSFTRESRPCICTDYRSYVANIVLDLGIKGERDLQKLKSLALRRLDEMDGVKVDQLH